MQFPVLLLGVAMQVGAVLLLMRFRGVAGNNADTNGNLIGACLIGIFYLGTLILLCMAWSERDFTLLLSQAVFILCMIVMGWRKK